MKILITGATGFVGARITADLINQGHEITCCVKNTTFAQTIFPNAKIIYCDFERDIEINTWEHRIKDIDIIINTIGIFYHRQKKVMWATHFNSPLALFKAAEQSSVKKIIHLSALGIENTSLDYAESKKALEIELEKLRIPVVILKPSLIYGQGSYGGSSLFRGLAGLPGFLPLINGGEQELQPIHISDLSKAVTNLVNTDSSKKYTLLHAVGLHKVTMKEILITLRKWLGFSKPFIFSVPSSLIYLCSLVGNLFNRSVINTTSYHLLQKNNVTTQDETSKFIEQAGLTPQEFSQALFSHPSTVQDRWHAKLFFVKPLLKIGIAFVWIFTALTSAFFYPISSSYALLENTGITIGKPLVLFSAITLDFLIGLALLFNYKIKPICILQLFIIVGYTLIITFKLPHYWLEPFGPITKNIPLLISIYILYILEDER